MEVKRGPFNHLYEAKNRSMGPPTGRGRQLQPQPNRFDSWRACTQPEKKKAGDGSGWEMEPMEIEFQGWKSPNIPPPTFLAQFHGSGGDERPDGFLESRAPHSLEIVLVSFPILVAWSRIGGLVFRVEKTTFSL